MAEFIVVLVMLVAISFVVMWRLKKKLETVSKKSTVEVAPVPKAEAPSKGVCLVGGEHEFNTDGLSYYREPSPYSSKTRLHLRNRCTKCDKYTQTKIFDDEAEVIQLIRDTIECTQEEAYWMQNRYLRDTDWTDFKKQLFTDLIRSREYIKSRAESRAKREGSAS